MVEGAGGLVGRGDAVPADDADVALVRRAFAEFRVRRDELDDYYRRFFTEDAVLELVDGFPLRGRYQGLEGYRRWFEDSYAPYEGVERRLDAIGREGDRVVALMTVTGRPRGDDTELRIEMGNTYEIACGRIRHLRVYVGHARAREAARSGG